jgi:transcriptional regulator with XRE-family HTH domain
MGNISTKLGQNMKRIKTKKMAQGDIARVLKVDRGYISTIENGKKNPDPCDNSKFSRCTWYFSR